MHIQKKKKKTQNVESWLPRFNSTKQNHHHQQTAKQNVYKPNQHPYTITMISLISFRTMISLISNVLISIFRVNNQISIRFLTYWHQLVFGVGKDWNSDLLFNDKRIF